MPCVKRSLLALAAVALLTFFPKVTFAATSTSCECFCGSAGAGAVDADAMTNAACHQTCIDTNTQFVGCFTDSQQYPDRNPKCWTQSECSTWSGMNGTTRVTATWQKGDMPYDCQKAKTSQEPMKYCYANDVPYTLNVAIGSVTKIQNLPTYINVIYTWLLPAASLIAVVMMMLGGLQYVMSRGKSKYIEKAKTRITNAITGLVLLLSAFVILNLIDPRLTALNTLKIPMIKEVTMLDATSSCERLADYGYTIAPIATGTVCGSSGKITDSSGLKEGTLGSWKDGDTCDYTMCAGVDSNKVCVADGDTKSCQSCSDIPSPTASACSSAEAFNSGQSGDTQAYCQYNSTLNSCTTAGTNLATMQGFYCGAMRTNAAEPGSSPTVKKGCEVYADLDFAYHIDQVGGFDPLKMNIPINSSGGAGSVLLEKICNADLCGVAKSVGASRCSYTVGTADPGFLATAVNYWGGTSIGTTGYYCGTVQ